MFRFRFGVLTSVAVLFAIVLAATGGQTQGPATATAQTPPAKTEAVKDFVKRVDDLKASFKTLESTPLLLDGVAAPAPTADDPAWAPPALPPPNTIKDDPAPTPAPPGPGKPVIAVLEGPAEVASGGFAISYTVTPGARVVWTNKYPPKSMPPMRATDENGQTMLAFLNSVPGVYEFSLLVQVPNKEGDGLDPLAFAKHTVTVGTPAPPPYVPPVVPPVVVPVGPAPSAAMQELLRDTKAVMDRADPAKRAEFAKIWRGYANALKTSPPIPTTKILEATMTAHVNATAQAAGLAGAFPGFSAALDAAFDKYFGTDDVPLDRAKADEMLAALVWACGG